MQLTVSFTERPMAKFLHPSRLCRSPEDSVIAPLAMSFLKVAYGLGGLWIAVWGDIGAFIQLSLSGY